MLSADKNALSKGVLPPVREMPVLAWHGSLVISDAPESGPAGKLETMRVFGAEIQILSDDWWQIIENSGHPDDAGFYVDAVRSKRTGRCWVLKSLSNFPM